MLGLFGAVSSGFLFPGLVIFGTPADVTFMRLLMNKTGVLPLLLAAVALCIRIFFTRRISIKRNKLSTS